MKKEPEMFEFEIPSWKEWQERPDRKNYSWFKFQNDFFMDERVSACSDQGKILFVYALCVRNKKVLDVCVMNFKVACSFLQWDSKTLVSAFNEISRLGLILPAQSRQKPSSARQKPSSYRSRLDHIQITSDHTKNFAVDDSSSRFTAAGPLASLQETFTERRVPTALQEAWLTAFPDAEWIMGEIRKALAWELSKSRRKKLFGAFITRWLTNGWDERKVPHHGISKADYSFLASQSDREQP